MIRKILKNLSIYMYRFTIIGLSTGKTLTRYYMYKHLSKYSEPRSADLRVLSISHSNHLANLLGFTNNQITDAEYPEFNILDLPFKDGEFDAIVSDQVLEHVKGNPQQAIDESLRVVKPNGVALHTTCFMYPIHSAPCDYWRFTPEALNLLVTKHGEVVDAGGWGNRYALLFCGLGLSLQPTPHARWHPVHWVANSNDVNWPIVTWVLIRKGA